jgi:hypothetical protein
MKIPTVVLLLVTLTLAGCVSEGPGGRTVIEAVAEADKIAAGVLEEPIFLYAFAAEGPQAVEFYESWLTTDVATAPFDFELDVTGDVMKEGRAMSWIVLYESQVGGGLAMVHVGETKGSKMLVHMDDGHTHKMGLELQPEATYCDTSPDLQTDSDGMALMLKNNSEYLDFQNQTPPDTRFYLLFAEGSCFNEEVVHWMGMVANETEALAVMADGAATLEFSFEQDVPLPLIDQQDTFSAPLAAATGDVEYLVTFEVPKEGSMGYNAGVNSHSAADPLAEVHISLRSPDGVETAIGTHTTGTVVFGGHVDVTPGTWTVVYHSTNHQPFATLEVYTFASM